MGRKKRLMHITALFFALIFSFTILSRASWQYATAVVTVSRPENKVISHQVTCTGKVVQNQELAVVTEPDQRVKAIYVKEGQKVKKGDLLFEIDGILLEEKILAQKQEMEKQQLQVQDARSQKEVIAMQKANEQAQAAENYSLNTESASARLSRAKRELQEAKRELKQFRENSGIQTGDSSVEEALENVFQEKQEAYIQAQQELTTLQWQIEKAVDDAKTEAQSSARAGLMITDTVHTGSGGELLLEDGDLPAEDGTDTDQAGAVGGETSDSGMSVENQGAELNLQEMPDLFPEEDLLVEDQPEAVDLEGEPTGNPVSEEKQGMDAAEEGKENNSTLSKAELDEIEDSVRSAWQPRLEEAERKAEQAWKEKEAARAALEEYRQERLSLSGDQNAQKEQQLLEAVQAASDAYEDAALAANEAAVTSKRAVASAGIPDAANSSDRMNEITYEQMEVSLRRLGDLKIADGKIYAPADGLIIKINITTGEKTSDTTAILMADLDRGYSFIGEITKDQEKYIGTGDLVTLTSGNGKISLEDQAVSSVRAAEEREGVYYVTVELPGDSFDIGTAVTMDFVKKSAVYSCCIPLSALHLDEKNRTYVLVAREQESVMGAELRAEKISVIVLEQNEAYAALREGSISGEQQVISNSNKTVEEGSRIRIEG